MSSKEREEASVGGVGEALEDEDIRAKRGERGGGDSSGEEPRGKTSGRDARG